MTTNPTIFAAALCRRRALRRRRCASSPPRAPTSTRRSSRSPPTTCATPATSSSRSTTPPTASTAGCRIEVEPGLAHDTDGTIAAGQGAVGGGRPAERVHQDPGDRSRASRRSPTTLAEGISVNVTLIFGLDRYRGGHGRLPRPASRRPRTPATTCRRSTRSPRSSSPASTPRSTSGSTRSAPTRPTRSRARPASPTPGSPTRPTRRSSPTDRCAGARRRRAPTRSVRCGPRPASRTRRYPDTLYVDRPGRRRTPSTRCRRRRSTRSPTTARSPATRSPADYADAAAGARRPRRRSASSYDDVDRRRSRSEGVDKFEKSLERAARRPSQTQLNARQGVSSDVSSASSVARHRCRRPTRRTTTSCPAWSPDQVACRLAAQDATLWGPDAEAEAAKRLAWVGLAAVLAAAGRRDRRRCATSSPPTGVDHVVLCGHGRLVARPRGHLRARPASSSPCSTPPTRTTSRRRCADRLERTVVVVSSKSGGTVETDSQRRAYEKAFRDAGIDPARAHRRRDRPGLAARRVRPARRATASSTPTPTSAAATRR